MKFAVATPEEMGFHGETSDRFPDWTLFHTDFLRPSEIRQRILLLLQEEETDNTEHHLVTLNRTVYDMVTYPESNCPGLWGFEDVFMWDKERLVPLLEVYEEEWLAHFSLGDVFDRDL